MNITEPDDLERHRHIIRQRTKIDYALLFALLMQLIALVWGAATLKAGVDNLSTTVSQMGDYSVLKYRVQQLEQTAGENKQDISMLKSQLLVPQTRR